MGYSGGQQPNPTYARILDSTESVRIEYDTSKIEYADLIVDVFRMHKPVVERTRQYRTVLFYGNEEEKNICEDAIRCWKEQNRGLDLFVDVEPLASFYQAEEYHQDYLKKKGM